MMLNLLRLLRLRVSIFIVLLVSATLLLLACKDDSFLSGVFPSSAEHVFHDQVLRRLGRSATVTHGSQPRFPVKHAANAGLEITIDGISELADKRHRIFNPAFNTAFLSQEKVQQRHIIYGGGMAVMAGLLLLAGAIVAIRKKGIIELSYPVWRGCCVWPPIELRYKEYAVLGSDADGERIRQKSFYSPMPPLAALSDLHHNSKQLGLSDKVRDAIDESEIGAMSNRLSSLLEEEGEEGDDNMGNNVLKQKMLRMKNVQKKDRAILEEQLNRMKRRRKVLLAFMFLVYVGLCFVPFQAAEEVSCGHGFFYETHLPFAGSLFFSKSVELVIYSVDTSIDGELGFRPFMALFFISFFGYTDGYRDAMALEIADACALSDNPIYNHPLAKKLHTTMFYSYFGGVVAPQWVILGLLGIFCDSSSAVLAKLLHMDVLAACISLPPNRMWLWYCVNIAITVLQNLPQGAQQFIFVRFVKQHLFLTVAITVSAVSSIAAFIRAMRRLAEAIGVAQAASRQAKSHHRIQYEWLSALEGHSKEVDGAHGIKRRRGWFSNLALHNRGVAEDFYDLKDGEGIGKGAFGDVVKSEHLGSKIKRAVKRMDKGGLEIRDVVREVQLMKELDHPNIIRLFETFHDRNNVYMVLELCEGTELFDAISEKGGLPERPAAICIQQAAQALNYIHACQICHRDIKPENFILKTKGQINEKTVLKLIDFGTARGFDKDCPIQTQQGTPHYMAPEVIKESYNQLCDVWSLGVVIYSTLSCRVPFDGGNEPMIFKAILDGIVPFPSNVWGKVSDEAKSLIKEVLVVQTKRLSAADILENPWVKRHGLVKKIPDAEALARLSEQLKNFGSLSEFKKHVLMAIAYELKDEAQRKQRDMFLALDTDDDGLLSKSELQKALHKADDGETTRIMSGVDVDGDSYIEYTEFLAATLEDKARTNAAALWRAFQLLDRHGNGLIQSHELRMLLRRDDDSEIMSILETWDKNRDGNIDFVEFLEEMGVEARQAAE